MCAHTDTHKSLFSHNLVHVSRILMHHRWSVTSRNKMCQQVHAVLTCFFFSTIKLQLTNRGRSRNSGPIRHPAVRLAVTQSLSMVLKLKAVSLSCSLMQSGTFSQRF